METLRNLAVRLRQSGVTLALSGVKRQVEDVLERTGALDLLERSSLHGADQAAIADLRARAEQPGA